MGFKLYLLLVLSGVAIGFLCHNLASVPELPPVNLDKSWAPGEPMRASQKACCGSCLLLLFVLSGIAVGYIIYNRLMSVPELPPVDLDKWWGPGAPREIEPSIRSFTIEFTDEMVADLKIRLDRASSFAPLEGVGFEYGFNNDYLKEVLDFWSRNYKFQERQTFLNQYPHFKTNIQGLDIHFIHVKPNVSKDVKVLPLLLLHGWPGSVREFYEIIPLLTTPRETCDFVFELIIPSLPGYGYSQAPAKTGFGPDQMAVVLRNLMHRLGRTKFYLQGGDWGAIVSQQIALFFPKDTLGIHINFMPASTSARLQWIAGIICPRLVVEDAYRDRMYPFGEKFMFLLEEMGYAHIQATKPDTIGVALRDSPAGLAAYILEKFSTWTNPAFRKLPDGGLTAKFTLTNLLDNIMIYWSSGSITTSMRLYSETMNKRYQGLKLSGYPITVPSAVANFKHEISYVSESTVKRSFVNLVQFNHFEDGGHFAAFELPSVLANDFFSAVSKMRNGE